MRLLQCVLFLIICNSYSQELEWNVDNTGTTPGERVVAIFDAGQIGTYDAISIVGEVIDNTGNWGFTFPKRSLFKAYVNFSQSEQGLIQDHPLPNITLRLRKISTSVVHLTANIPATHKGARVLFRKVEGFANLTMGNPAENNNTGELLIDKPVYGSFFISNNGLGNVGLGTTNPDEKLTVKGNIHAEEIKVDLSVPAPDYVFEKDYELKSLEDVRDYVNKNGHLPEIPSASEFERDGISVGVMNLMLLKKVEELTLYLIDEHKKNSDQEKNINKLKQQVQELLKSK
tara:strand:+ start:23447 stop:24307 length:861 start_codon:yes stop_codon:yes gene_type:complete